MELFHEQRGVGGVMKLFGEELKNILRSLLMILHLGTLSEKTALCGKNSQTGGGGGGG